MEQVRECASEHAGISRTRDASARARSASRPSGRAAPSGAPSTSPGRCRQRCLACWAAFCLSGLCKRSAKGNFWVNFLFQGETAYDACPFLDENPKKRFRAFPKRIAQMAAAAKVALMEAQSGEERKWGAGTYPKHTFSLVSWYIFFLGFSPLPGKFLIGYSKKLLRATRASRHISQVFLP